MVSRVVSRAFIPAAGRSMVDRLVSLVELVCFWTAVVLPIIYIPGFLLAAWGYVSSVAFVAVVALNIAVAAVGHRHDPGRHRASEE